MRALLPALIALLLSTPAPAAPKKSGAKPAASKPASKREGSIPAAKPAKPALVAPKPAAPPPAPGPTPATDTKKDVALPAPRANKTRYFEGMGRTPEEEKLLQEISEALASYEAESKEFR